MSKQLTRQEKNELWNSSKTPTKAYYIYDVLEGTDILVHPWFEIYTKQIPIQNDQYRNQLCRIICHLENTGDLEERIVQNSMITDQRRKIGALKEVELFADEVIQLKIALKNGNETAQERISQSIMGYTLYALGEESDFKRDYGACLEKYSINDCDEIIEDDDEDGEFFDEDFEDYYEDEDEDDDEDEDWKN